MLGYNRCGPLVSSLFLNVDIYDLTLNHCILSCFSACNYLFLKFSKGEISLSFMGFDKSILRDAMMIPMNIYIHVYLCCALISSAH